MSGSAARAFWRPGTVAPGSGVSKAESGAAAGGGGDEAAELSLDGLVVYNPRQHLSIKQQRLLLPIYAQRLALLWSVHAFPTTIVVGSTELPQYLDFANWTRNGRRVAITQPRRVACLTIAQRVSEEMGTTLGHQVGYRVRFDDCTDLNPAQLTRVVFLTDGLLLREALHDPLLSSYSVVVVDEAHERSLQSDVLLAVLRRIQQRRRDLRIVVSSATLDVQQWQTFFAGSASCGVVAVEGRQWPVDILYCKQPVRDYVQAAVDTVQHLHRSQRVGDVLVFMTGRDEVDTVVAALADGDSAAELLLLPLYASLPPAQQLQVFSPAPAGRRKVVVATNIAEASVTVDGIAFVVDCGFCKLRSFSPATGVSSLTVCPISQAAAQQRAGRAGRTRAGMCFRLYTEEAYRSLAASTPPELQRSELTSVVLQLCALGVEDLLRFPFPSPPPPPLLLSALDLLYTAGAITQRGALTAEGERLAALPVDPFVGRMLLAGAESGCLQETLSIASMLCVQDVWLRGEGIRGRARVRKRQMHFAVEQGDHLTLYNLYSNWAAVPAREQPAWCRRYCVSQRAMVQAQQIQQQLSSHLSSQLPPRPLAPATPSAVMRAVTAGFFHHAARRGGGGGEGVWRDVRSGLVVSLDSESVLCEEGKGGGSTVDSNWLIYHELLDGSGRRFMRCVSCVQAAWLLELAPHYYQQKAQHRPNAAAFDADGQSEHSAVKQRRIF